MANKIRLLLELDPAGPLPPPAARLWVYDADDADLSDAIEVGLVPVDGGTRWYGDHRFDANPEGGRFFLRFVAAAGTGWSFVAADIAGSTTWYKTPEGLETGQDQEVLLGTLSADEGGEG